VSTTVSGAVGFAASGLRCEAHGVWAGQTAAASWLEEATAHGEGTAGRRRNGQRRVAVCLVIVGLGLIGCGEDEGKGRVG
jgi:hypothetical protein